MILLEGRLADADKDDAAADADAISLHSHFGPRGRRRPPPRTPRHIALWGFSLFESGRPERARADLCRRARRRARKEMQRFAAAAASHSPHSPHTEFEGFPGSGGPATPSPSAHRGIPAPFLPQPPAIQSGSQSQANTQRAAADFDGLSYARLAPRASAAGGSGSRSSGRSSNSGSGAGYSASAAGYECVGAPRYVGGKKKRSKSGRRGTKCKSSATSSTLASPRAEEFGAFASAGPLKSPTAFEGAALEEGGDDFDGTLGFSAREGAPSFAEGAFDGVPGSLDGLPREALSSPGLSRGFSRGRGKSGGGGGAFLANA
ncbi:hypothetical protein B0H17DRAFT_1194219 [Mycena rosella]|uniref:Uncharacterized protein n=1 Tax=Mycena rosella TaxID=1033263 RepID=A0AAD7GRM8_MYCRO|nr:hypothetical protein B0H17DRAFT_1194219 [Mycena rosella]